MRSRGRLQPIAGAFDVRPVADVNASVAAAERGWARIDADRLARCGEAVAELRAQLDEAQRRMEGETRAGNDEEWKQWISTGIQAGARNAHAYSRLPTEWQPATARIEGGLMSAAPEALLAEQRDKHRAHWKPADGPIRYEWASGGGAAADAQRGDP